MTLSVVLVIVVAGSAPMPAQQRHVPFDPPQTHIRQHKVSVPHLVEHVILGAGSYAGCAAIGDPAGRWKAGVACVGLTASWKELYGDLRNHKDSRGMAWFHWASIVGGGAAVGAGWH